MLTIRKPFCSTTERNSVRFVTKHKNLPFIDTVAGCESLLAREFDLNAAHFSVHNFAFYQRSSQLVVFSLLLMSKKILIWLFQVSFAGNVDSFVCRYCGLKIQVRKVSLDLQYILKCSVYVTKCHFILYTFIIDSFALNLAIKDEDFLICSGCSMIEFLSHLGKQLYNYGPNN